jgi:hypothetical protein
MTITCKTIRATAWEAAIQQAQEFLATLEVGQIVSISNVSESPFAVIFIWYVPKSALPDFHASSMSQ